MHRTFYTVALSLAITTGGSSPSLLRLTPALMVNVSRRNRSLLNYFFPSRPRADVRQNWVPFTPDCEISSRCFCFHVEGLMSKDLNPEGASRCFSGTDGPALQDCSQHPKLEEDCGCLVPPPNCTENCCLFSDMRPLKLLAAIALMREVGVTHVIEEGRYGGLSALIYAHHGFRVTSVEGVPLTHVTGALRMLAPDMSLVDGDGAYLLPQLLADVDPEKEKVAVIFDGEKQFKAYETYQKIRDKVAVAIFDDTNIGWKYFRTYLTQVGETVWHSDDRSFRHFARLERAPLDELLKPLRGSNIQGGMGHLEMFEYTIIEGGAWPKHGAAEDI
eukprot:gnl/TRDRNA2_/TRDRNA2_139731_c0_seq1.p1 gnl/TRDRNA2_/TRDRNA2_139731_c0~~gnl/TRDRNA2_/TRDRNA2_139731_c0_seq1.p1  ORF type:complete len:331 (-),score=48.46 gnl/TRDRNA2_/TRDRNA2_139731_c0_seq1:19-1011(-)